MIFLELSVSNYCLLIHVHVSCCKRFWTLGWFVYLPMNKADFYACKYLNISVTSNNVPRLYRNINICLPFDILYNETSWFIY